jgi:hypothetical protein
VTPDPGTTVAGWVVSTDGLPVAGAPSDVQTSQETATDVTAADGFFTIKVAVVDGFGSTFQIEAGAFVGGARVRG